jgi:tetratricopeptide (TPR) repeat protein
MASFPRVGPVSSGPLNVSAVCAFWRGEFGQVDEILAESEQAFLGCAPTDEVLQGRMLRGALSGVVASLRGDLAVADEKFDDALNAIGTGSLDEARVVVLAMRAAFAGETRPERALADARLSRELAAGFDDRRLAAMAEVGEGWALAELGRLTEAARVLESACIRFDGALQRSVAMLRLAEVDLRLGDRAAARGLVDEARQVFDDHGARYWSTRAALFTGTVDRDRSGRWLRLARETAGADRAYARLFRPDGELRVDPAKTPGVRRNGEPVRFITRHAEAAVRLLAAAGCEGVRVDVMASTFWPDADRLRVAARTRTMLWQARNSLGPDAWRIQRHREVVILETSGLLVVGTTTPDEVAAEFQPRVAASADA